jgi:UDP-N-acetylenolpyruvoylglucosamine reductase
VDPIFASTVASSLRSQLKELRATGRAEFYERVDLRAWTALRLGGTADLVIRCRSLAGAAQVLDLLAAHGLGWMTIGSGSRVVPPDRGLRVPVVTFGGELARWLHDEHGLVVGAGANVGQLARSLAGQGITGLERLIGTSGSLGGTFARDVGRARPPALGVAVRWYECQAPGRPTLQCRVDRDERPPDLRRWVIVRAGLDLESDGVTVPGERAPSTRTDVVDGTIGPVFETPGGDEVDVEHLLAAAGCADLGRGGVRSLRSNPNRLRVSRGGSSTDVVALIRRMRDRVEERYGVVLPLRLEPVDEVGRLVDL